MPAMQPLQSDMDMTDALRKHITRHVLTPKPVTQRRLNFENARPRWLREMVAEATGVFFYGTKLSSLFLEVCLRINDTYHNQYTLE